MLLTACSSPGFVSWRTGERETMKDETVGILVRSMTPKPLPRRSPVLARVLQLGVISGG